MRDIGKHLHTDEKIMFQTGPIRLSCRKGFLLSLVLMVILPPLGVLLIFVVILKKLSTKYALTNRRILKREGILNEKFKSVNLKFVTSLEVVQGIIGKLFNFGDVIVDTAGSGEKTDLTWKYVSNPIKTKNFIEETVDKFEKGQI